MSKQNKNCINPKCKNKQHTRGLCMACYKHAKELYESGMYTERQLIDAGKMLPPHHNRRKKFDWLSEGVK